MTEAQGNERRAPAPEPVLAELAELMAEHDSAAQWEAAVASFGTYLADTADPWPRVAARIERCLADGRPASFIRLGDGEGNLLALALGEYPALTDYCVRADSRLHLGDPELLLRAAPEVLPAFDAALGNAELIGVPGPFGAPNLLRRDDADAYVRPIQGLACVHRYLVRFAGELGLERTVGAPAGYHRGLLPHYEALVAGRRIGIVSCRRELAEGMRARMGAASVDLRPVPPQAAVARAGGADTGHWPGRYRELIAELATIEAGTLWFVAAGMLGKVYCETIRAAGGVAVDVGHTADVWAGVRSRASIRPAALDRWRIVEPRPE